MVGDSIRPLMFSLLAPYGQCSYPRRDLGGQGLAQDMAWGRAGDEKAPTQGSSPPSPLLSALCTQGIIPAREGNTLL